MKRVLLKLVSVAAAALLLVTPTLEGCSSYQGESPDTSGAADDGKEKITTAEKGGDPLPPVKEYEKDPVLAISEICVQNRYGAEADDGQRHPWIELYASSALELSEYSISYAGGGKIALPSARLQSGEYYLLFLKGAYAIENISSSAEIVLYHGELASQRLIYVNRTPDCSYLVSAGGESRQPTPGYKNALPAGELIITEIMADNTKFPVNGVLCDYVEIKNISRSDLSLDEYFLSDDAGDPYMNRLPKVTLKPDEYYLFTCSDQTFGISKNGETVVLTRRDGVAVSVITFDALDKNLSYTPDGVTDMPSPGYPNTKEGMYASICSRTGLVINEVLASNVSAYKAGGDYFDAIELYNNSGAEIELSDYYVTDKLSDPERYRLPAGTLAAHEYYVVLLDKSEGGPSFGISSNGESLKITRSDGYVTDVVSYPQLMADISYGRTQDQLVYFEAPTIGKVNGNGYDSISVSPAASETSGVYSSPVSLTLTGDGSIYYTTDGTKPTVKSKKYSGETVTFTHTGTIRMICKKGDLITSPESSYSYMIEERDYTLPSVMLSLKDSEMFGTNGIWTRNVSKNGSYITDRSEIEGRITFIEDGEEKFSVGCGFKIFGGMTRYYAKKSISVKFRAKYGESTLDYKLFDDCDLDSFNSLVLRAGGQSLLNAVMKDEFVSSLALTGGTMPNILMQAYRPVNLFINGEYYGVYFLKEKIDEHFVAAHEGCEPEDVTIIDHMGTIKEGSSDLGWSALWKYIKNNDLTVRENYDYVCSQFDIESLADHYILQMWAQNTDTGNVRIYRTSQPGSKWKFILYDLDLSFNVSSPDTGALVYIGEYKSSGKPYNPLIIKMLRNDEFRAFFYERMELQLGSTLSSVRAAAFIEEMRSVLAHDMEYEIERWKDVASRYNKSIKSWNTHVSNIQKRVGGNYSEQTYADIDDAIKKVLKMKI